MKEFNKKRNRRSIRLKGYDYSQAGLYFITICSQNREYLFGACREKIGMQLNDAGKMVEKWYFELENKYLTIRCHNMVVMPNHIHFVIEITNPAPVPVPVPIPVPVPVGADLRVCPDKTDTRPTLGEHVPVNRPTLGEHAGSPLRYVIQWFKTMTTNEYIRGVKQMGWTPFDKRMWQRNYWEQIIRSEHSYYHICNYIDNNPLNWEKDSQK